VRAAVRVHQGDAREMQLADGVADFHRQLARDPDEAGLRTELLFDFRGLHPDARHSRQRARRRLGVLDRLGVGIDGDGSDALGQHRATRVENRPADRLERDGALLLALRAREVFVVPDELHLRQPGDDDHRPRGQEGEELKMATVGEGHRRAAWVGRELGSADGGCTTTMVRGSMRSNPSAAAFCSTALSEVRRSI